MRPQPILRALGALGALFRCITYSASQQDSSGPRPQPFLFALSALFHLFECIPRSAGWKDSSGPRPQPILRALGALRALFECITYSASRQDSSGPRPQHFLSALSALFNLFKCIKIVRPPHSPSCQSTTTLRATRTPALSSVSRYTPERRPCIDSGRSCVPLSSTRAIGASTSRPSTSNTRSVASRRNSL